MFEQLPEAKRHALQLIEEGIKPFEIVDSLNEKFDGLFYLSHGNIFRLIPGELLADIVYSKKSSYES